jgi:hypothetical protein
MATPQGEEAYHTSAVCGWKTALGKTKAPCF